MKKKTKSFVSLCLIVGLLLVVFILEQVLPSTHMLFAVLKKGAIYALVAVSMNLLNGFTGLFSLGQAGFMLLGAYTYAIFTIPVEAKTSVYQYFNCIIPFSLPELFTFGTSEAAKTVGTGLGILVALVLAGLIAAGFAALIGLPVLRLKSDYLAIATLGFAEIIRAVFQWKALGPLTNGSNLLKSFPSFNDFNIKDAAGNVIINLSTLIPFIIAGLCIFIIVLLINSSHGRAFKAIREDEIAAEAMGINLARHKLLSFCISSGFAGVGGAMLAMFQTTVQAMQFKAAMTYEILLIVVIGGIGSVTGSCIASFLFVACSEWWLRFLDQDMWIGAFKVPFLRSGFRLVVFSIIIMIVVLFFRRGIMGDKEFSLDGIYNFFTGKGRKAKKKVGEPHE